MVASVLVVDLFAIYHAVYRSCAGSSHLAPRGNLAATITHMRDEMSERCVSVARLNAGGCPVHRMGDALQDGVRSRAVATGGGDRAGDRIIRVNASPQRFRASSRAGPCGEQLHDGCS